MTPQEAARELNLIARRLMEVQNELANEIANIRKVTDNFRSSPEMPEPSRSSHYS
jgi:hypothetical protein